MVNNATKLVTPLVIGNVSMPDKNPSFVVQPPKVITGGGWFSFHTLLDWAKRRQRWILGQVLRLKPFKP
jgi:hypothetical protein